MSIRRWLRIPTRPIPRLLLAALGSILLLFATIGVLSVTRGTPVRIVLSTSPDAQPPAIGDPLFARTMELYTGLHLEPDNTVEELVDGNTTYPPLWRDLRAARRAITVQMYYSLQGAVADTMRAVLIERARAGVRVLLLLDAFGSQDLTEEWREGLTRAGVRVALLRPLRWYTLHKAANRSHVRVVVVDGRIAYTGGFGLADYWLGGGRAENEWRDSNVRFSGPAVPGLQAAFAAAWAEATGELLTGALFFPHDAPMVGHVAVADSLARAAPPETLTPAPRGGAGPDTASRAAPMDTARAPIRGVMAGLLFTQPTEGSTGAERFLALTIAGTRRRLWIANSYFVPDDDFRAALARAAQRGVDVRVLTVGPKTDVKTTRYAGRARYEQLLASGVRIYEYVPSMMHGKTIVADGLFGTIGSLNFDNRSLAFNNESNLVVLDSAFAARMERTYLEDLRYSKEILLPDFRRRGWKERLLERGATLLSRIL